MRGEDGIDFAHAHAEHDGRRCWRGQLLCGGAWGGAGPLALGHYAIGAIDRKGKVDRHAFHYYGTGRGAMHHHLAHDAALLKPAARVRVTQQLPQNNTVWTTTIEGTVLRYRQAKTGSWFAHAKEDKLWLDRLELRKDDGELVTLNLDCYSVIEAL